MPHCASLRMVVDFADTNKIMAVLPGGVTGRMFHPHHKDQVTSYMSGEKKTGGSVMRRLTGILCVHWY
ncbi:MAG: penicillin acylase family protein [Desulfotignum sp.]|nr:penicillin acylase family protein [Desulfotignum sp.]MCF8089486.1 penicillin acylase family protein [Desulfotignum sp.]MCF8135764.1 penicillin acylase family protein [Desulfotignum sp.]